jgi:hypothetical protein
LHTHFEGISIDSFDPARSSSSTEDADAQFVTGNAAQNFANVEKPATRKTCSIFADEIFTFEQYEVQIVTES